MGELLWRIAVTFCEEGADWNRTLQLMMLQWTRHLLWGRCGLKCGINLRAAHSDRSPSVRKVRIEIRNLPSKYVINSGHLLWGRCGLKSWLGLSLVVVGMSPSVRKVRIEILGYPVQLQNWSVTFCEEGADWNWKAGIMEDLLIGHLLWGRCGLKLSR